MPYVWEDNELFLSHEGVDVYHIYKNDFDVCREYWYGLYPHSSDDDMEGVFDVRELPCWEVGADHADVIKAAIDAGHPLLQGGE